MPLSRLSSAYSSRFFRIKRSCETWLSSAMLPEYMSFMWLSGQTVPFSFRQWSQTWKVMQSVTRET
jgi:hypothetical protein